MARVLAGGVLACVCGGAAMAAEPTTLFTHKPDLGEALWREDATLAGDFEPGQGLRRWRSSEASVVRSDGAIDSVRLTFSGVDPTPGGAPVGALAPFDPADADRIDIAVTRDWPNALRLKAGGLDFDLSPRAGVDVSEGRASLATGATVRVGGDLGDQIADEVLSGLGLNTVESSTFEGRGRWYLFAAADGRAVGMNIARDRDGDWSRQGWSSDPTSVVGEAQVGVGWRKGAMQASFGLVQREIKSQGVRNVRNGKIEDEAVAFTLSFKPGR